MAVAVLPEGREEIVGRVEYLTGMGGAGIRPRDVVVWLPPSYDREPGLRYPVLYQQDGHNAVDPATSYDGVDWQIDEVACELAGQGRIREFLMVGAYCTDDRFEEYGYGETGAAYLRWVSGALKAEIDRRYRTLTGRLDTFVMGSSMGGLISLLAAWWEPATFGGAACLSPFFPDELVADLEEPGVWPSGPLRVYLDNGGDDLDRSFQPNVDHVRALLAGLGADTAWYRDAGAPHHESAWAQRVWRPLEFLFGPRGDLWHWPDPAPAP